MKNLKKCIECGELAQYEKMEITLDIYKKELLFCSITCRQKYYERVHAKNRQSGLSWSK